MNVRETAERDTPARSATSCALTNGFCGIATSLPSCTQVCTILQLRATRSRRSIPYKFVDTLVILVQHLHALATTAPGKEAPAQSGRKPMGLVKLAAAALAAGATFFAYSAKADGNLNLICSADVVICEQMKGAFEKKSGVSVNMVSSRFCP